MHYKTKLFEYLLERRAIMNRYFFWAAYRIRGPKTKFADEGLAIMFIFFRITREIFQFGIWQFNIIAKNEKAFFRENFSSWRFDSGRIFKTGSLDNAIREFDWLSHHGL